MKLSELREMLFSLRSWASSGTARDEQVNKVINLGLKHLSSDFRQAFVPDQEHAVVYEDHVSLEDGETQVQCEASGDAWVLEFVDSAGNPYPAATDPNRFYPVTDGSWDGVMHIEIKDTNGVWHRRQSREWWRVAEGIFPITAYHYYVSLDRRFEDTLGENLDFRIHQPRVYVEGDVLEVESVRVWKDTNSQVRKLAMPSAEQMDMIDFQGSSSGYPQHIIDGEHFKMPTPNYSPVPEGSQQITWVGKEDMGTFRFVYTYVWGKNDPEWKEAPGRDLLDPTWESQPSPISAAYTHVEQEGITLTLPNIDWMQWFDVTGTVRQSHSGYRKRIYVARDAVSKLAPSWNPQVESGGIFYLIDEVDGNDTEWIWDGSITPDYHRRLKEINGYYSWALWPHQDDRYELDFRILRAPQKLVNDQDNVPILSSALPAFIQLILYYGAMVDGADVAAANDHLTKYEDMASTVRARLDNRGGVISGRTWGTQSRRSLTTGLPKAVWSLS